jgi:hypothetical protein
MFVADASQSPAGLPLMPASSCRATNISRGRPLLFATMASSPARSTSTSICIDTHHPCPVASAQQTCA